MSARKAKRQPKAKTVIERNKGVRAAYAHLVVKLSPESSMLYVPIAGAEALKPCPFCGDSKGWVELIDQGVYKCEGVKHQNIWAHVQCNGCGIHGPEADAGCEGDDDTPHGLIVEAVRMWNDRDSRWAARHE